MTLRAVLAAQGNLKGQGMARRSMPCPFQFSSARQGGVRWPTCELGIWGQVPFPLPDIQSPACNQLRKQGFFVRHTQAGKRYPPLYSQYFGLGLWARSV